MSGARVDTLYEALQRAADCSTGAAFVVDGRGEKTRIPYDELLRRAHLGASVLRARGVPQKAPIVFQVSDLGSYLVAFWSAVVGGYVPVPLQIVRSSEHLAKLLGVLAQLDTPWMLHDAQGQEALQKYAVNSDAARVLSTRALSVSALREGKDDQKRVAVGANDIAFVQFSSGTTGDPKGIVLSHANVCANIHGIIDRAGADPNEVSLSWMPLTHDMGLVGFHLAPVVLGMDHYLMQPSAFLRRPRAWLSLASEVKASVLSLPSFGLSYALAHTDDAFARTLDLSHVRLVFVGADYVSHALCVAFAARLSSARFRSAAIFPSYGLAESTVAVTLPRPLQAMRTARVSSEVYVGVGTPIAGMSLRIVDEEGKSVPEGVIGRIQIAGTSLARGYMRQGHVEALPLQDGYYDTGDLGFMNEGDLVMTGRLKDLVCVAGENFQLGEVDRVLSSALGIELATFADPDEEGRERIGVALQSKAKDQELRALVAQTRRAASSAFGLALSRVVGVSSLPRTTSGKIRRGELQTAAHRDPPSVVPQSADLVAQILRIVREVTGETLEAEEGFLERGIPSIALIEIASRLSLERAKEVHEVDLFSHPNARSLAEHLAGVAPSSPPGARVTVPDDEPIAVVGIGVRVPLANGPEEFLNALLDKRVSVGELPRTRSSDLDRYVRLRGLAAASSPKGSYLPRIDEFDAQAFGLTRGEATLLHPTHRLFLELAYEAFSDAGLSRDELAKNKVGLFLGHVGDFEGTDYRELVTHAAPDLLGASITGNLSAFLAGRIAHVFDLKGPAMMVDTACSASLVAVHLAANSLRRGECRVALAGGARTSVLPLSWPTHMGFESKQGQIRPFDAQADGTLLGEGGGAVVLKRLSDALVDGDRIYATILGSAVNHDGRAASMTAPNPDAQARVIEEAWKSVKGPAITPRFIETHGAATVLSDTVEVEALSRAFERCDFTDACALGSVKSNVGHLFEGAGILAFVKSALALHAKKIPATLAHDAPSPRLLATKGRFFVNREAMPLEGVQKPLRAGITSIGFSGTNCHVAIEEAPTHKVTRTPQRRSLKRQRCWIEIPESKSEPVRGHEVVAMLATPATPRTLAAKLSEIVHLYAGVTLVDAENDARGFFELGLDSLVLIQMRQAVERSFGVRIEVRRFFEDILSPRDLIAHLLANDATILDASASAVIAKPVVKERVLLEHPTAAPRERSSIEKRQRVSKHIDRYADELGKGLALALPKSKSLTDEARPRLANNRAVAGFRPAWKELVFPVYFQEAEGAYFTDIDGRRYLDLTMGFGVHLFGHKPAFIDRAIAHSLAKGASLGPLHSDTAEVARRLCELTGVERVAFFNSGTEAVMVALRLARTHTHRSKIVIFRGAYHGSFDAVLAIATAEDASSMPFSLGTPESMVKDTVVLEYGSPEALDYIWEHGHEIAAVLVEPVQSRRPEFQPRDFLHELRGVTREQGIALVFDEVITGFRLHPGGAQAFFDVRADLVVYGKVIGGGMPIGVVGGSQAWMSGIDGGAWRFGDASLPEASTTFVAGTFCHHPLAMAAARAVLDELATRGPALQRELEERTRSLVARCNELFERTRTPMTAVYCGSLFRFHMAPSATLLYAKLLLEGVYVWEGRNCFLSTAHSDADCDLLLERLTRSLESMHRARVFEEDLVYERIPLHRTQMRTWQSSKSSLANACVGNQLATLRIRGELDIDAMERALAQVVARHEALRFTRVSDAGFELPRSTSPSVKLVHDRLDDARLHAYLRAELERPFDFDNGPFFRVHLIETGKKDFVLALVMHRVLADGYSMGLFLEELGRLYSASVAGVAPELKVAEPYDAYATWLASVASSRSETVAVSQIALDGEPRAGVVTPAELLYTKIDRARLDAMKEEARTKKISLFAYVMAELARFLHARFRPGIEQTVSIGVPIAGQPLMDKECALAQCVEVVPITVRFANATHDVFAEVRERLAETYRAPRLGLGELSTWPNVVLNLDRSPPLSFADLQASYEAPVAAFTSYDLVVNLVEDEGALHVEWKYRQSVPKARAEQWLREFIKMLEKSE